MGFMGCRGVWGAYPIGPGAAGCTLGAAAVWGGTKPWERTPNPLLCKGLTVLPSGGRFPLPCWGIMGEAVIHGFATGMVPGVIPPMV